MSTTYDDQQEFAQARAAIAAFNKVAPQLTMYARTLTGKPVRVVPGSQTKTDGNNIYIRPPLSMAVPLKHVRSLCEKYDVDGISLCAACASRENLMYQLQHEIAHIMFGSFDNINRAFMYNYWTAAMAALPEKVYQTMRTKEMELTNGKHPLPLIGLVNQSGDTHLPTLQLFTEDLRIDERSYIERPGLRKQAYAQYRSTLHDGVPAMDGGEPAFWYTYPIDMQICAAVLFKTKGLDVTNHLDDEAVAVVNDHKIEKMLGQTITAADQYETGIVTIRLLRRIRDLGYMTYIEPEEEESDEDEGEPEDGDDQSDEPNSDDQSGSEGDGSDGNEEGDDGSGDGQDGTESEGDNEGDDKESDTDDAGSDEHDKGESDKPRRAARQSELDRLIKALTGHDREIKQTETPEELEGTDSYEAGGDQEENLSKVLDAAWLLDHIPRNIAGIKEFGKGEGEAYEPWGYGRNYGIQAIPETVIGKSITQARIAFSNNARVTHQRNQRSGKINGNVLGKRAALGDDRLFGRKITPDKRNYHVLMGLDISYSTANGNIDHIKRATLALADVCARVGVDFSIYAHSTTEDDWYNKGESALAVGMWKVKETGDKWDSKAKKFLSDLRPVSGNLDGHSLQYYRKKLDAERATDKVLMYFTDGAMPASNYEEELMVLQSEIAECKRRNYTLLGVGVGTNSPTAHGLETVRVDGPNDYPDVVKMLSKRIIRSN